MKAAVSLLVVGLIGLGFSSLGGQELVEEHVGLQVGTPRIGDTVSYSVQANGNDNTFSVLSTSEATVHAILDYLGDDSEVISGADEIHFAWTKNTVGKDPFGEPNDVWVLVTEHAGFTSEFGYKESASTPSFQKWAFDSIVEQSQSRFTIIEESTINQNSLIRTDFNPDVGIFHCLARSEWQGKTFAHIGNGKIIPECVSSSEIISFQPDGRERINGFDAHRFAAVTLNDMEVSVSFIPGLPYPARLSYIDGDDRQVFTLTGFEEGTGEKLPPSEKPNVSAPSSLPTFPSEKWGPPDYDASLDLPPSQAYDIIMNHPDLEEFHEWREKHDTALKSFRINVFSSNARVDQMTFIADDGSEADIWIHENLGQFGAEATLAEHGLIKAYRASVWFKDNPDISEIVVPDRIVSLGRILDRLEAVPDYGSLSRLEISMGTIKSDGSEHPPSATVIFHMSRSWVSWDLTTNEPLVDHHYDSKRLESLSEVTTSVNDIVNRIVNGEKYEEQRLHTSGISFQGTPPDNIAWDIRYAAIAAVVLPLIYLAFKFVVFLHTRFLPQESLKLPNRGRLLDIIRIEPGISTNDIKKHTGLSMGTVLYHLKVLERDKHIVRVSSGKYTRYFPQGYGNSFRMHQKAVELDAGAEHRVFSIIASAPGIHAAELARRLNVSRPSILEAVARLEGRGLLRKQKDGRRLLLYPGIDQPKEPKTFDHITHPGDSLTPSING